MEGFAMLLGHLVGDYILQEDWQARNKGNPWPGREPYPQRVWLTAGDTTAEPEGLSEQRAWWKARDQWRVGHLACTVHCTLYALSCWLFCHAWMPWWAALLVGVAHWPIDRFRLPRLAMERVTNQRAFATGPCAPWSFVLVDQIWHLLTLYGVWLLCNWVTP